MRTNDWLLCGNGVDEMRYIDLATLNMTSLPSWLILVSVLTAAAYWYHGTGPFNVYYAITYNSDGGGETAIGPILSQAVSKSRSTWASDGTEYLDTYF
jgi:hypothetical protein